MKRVAGSVTKIAERVEASRGNGVLQHFNAKYREQRLAAQLAGKRIVPYTTALSRLRKVLASHAAAQANGFVGPDIMREVFGEDCGN